MPYILLLASISVGLLNSGLQNLFSKRKSKSTADRLTFSMVASLGAAGTLLALNFGFSMPSLYTFLLGIAYGAITAFAQIASLSAYASGPMSLTVLVNNCSMLIPTFSGALLWGEVISLPQYVGISLLVIGLFFALNPKKDKAVTWRWMSFCLISFLGNGVVGVMQKLHQTSAHKEELNEFLITAFLTSAIMLACILFFLIRRGNIPQAFSPVSLKPVLLALFSGIGSGIVNNLNLYLSGALPAVIFFPLFNGGVILLNALSARIIFKEHLSRRQLIGLLLAVLALCLISNIAQLFLL